MTREEALQMIIEGYVALHDRSGAYLATWKAFHAGEITHARAVEASKLLTKLCMEGNL